MLLQLTYQTYQTSYSIGREVNRHVERDIHLIVNKKISRKLQRLVNSLCQKLILVLQCCIWNYNFCIVFKVQQTCVTILENTLEDHVDNSCLKNQVQSLSFIFLKIKSLSFYIHVHNHKLMVLVFYLEVKIWVSKLAQTGQKKNAS